MKTFIMQVKNNFMRLIVRNPRFFLFDVAIPAGFYVLFTKVMNQGMPASFNQTYLVSMAIYATILSSIITVANNIFADHEQQYMRFIDVSPISRGSYYTSMGTVLFLLTLIEVGIVEAVAKFYIGVSFPLTTWLAILVLASLGSIPIMILGVALAFCGSSDLISMMTYMLVFPLAILSGLWWPMQMMPTWAQHIGKLLPTYQTSVIVNDVVNQKSWSLTATGGEVAWLVIALVILISVQKIKRVQQA